jgi:hypothetical protein
MRGAAVLPQVLPVVIGCLTTGPEAMEPADLWAKASKIVSQNKPFLLIS